MSQLAADSLLDLEKQVLLLVTYIETDPRHSVKMVALRELKVLAKKGPHLWQEDVVEVGRLWISSAVSKIYVGNWRIYRDM